MGAQIYGSLLAITYFCELNFFKKSDISMIPVRLRLPSHVFNSCENPRPKCEIFMEIH